MPEPEVPPPQRIWLDRHSLRLPEFYLEKHDDGDVEYVPASALAEVWLSAIKIVNEASDLYGAAGELKAARAAALSAGKGGDDGGD